MTHLACRQCGKPFSRKKPSQSGLCSRCWRQVPEKRNAYLSQYREKNRERLRAYAAAWRREQRAKDPERARAAQRKRRDYGVNRARYDAMVEAQGGRCAICKTPNPKRKWWCVDYDHETGRVRGLLCHRCNLMLGNMEDNVEWLLSAAAYLCPNLTVPAGGGAWAAIEDSEAVEAERIRQEPR
jgi:hypothetical protein